MNNNLLNYDLLKELKTTDKVDQLSSSIDSVFSNFYKTRGTPLAQTLDASLGNVFADAIKNILAENKISPTDYESAEKILTKLKDELKNLKVMNITVAIEPTQKMISNIFEWVYKNIGQDVILDITKDEKILGGAVVSFEGNYRDFSLKKALDETFINKKSEILNSILGR